MRKRLTITIFLLFLLTVLIFFNNTRPLVQVIQGGAQKVFAAPKSWIYRTKTELFTTRDDELQALKKENAQLSQQLNTFKGMEKDNEALRSQFAENPEKAPRMLHGNVVGFEGLSHTPTKLIIDVGSEKGVKKDMTVVSGKNLVGKIGKVSQTFAVVILPVSPDFSDVAKTVQHNAEGVVTGQNNFILLDHVSINDKLQKSEIVVTKGSVGENGLGLQPDYIIGKIKSFSRVETESFQTAEVESFLKYSELSEIFVML